jgi:hypothetical protein
MGAASPFRPGVERLGGVSDARRDEFLQAVDQTITLKVAPAITRLAAAVQGDYRAKAPQAVGLGQYPGGPEIYRVLVKFHTTMEVTPEEVHAIGLKNVERIALEMAGIRAELEHIQGKSLLVGQLRRLHRPKLREQDARLPGSGFLTGQRHIGQGVDGQAELQSPHGAFAGDDLQVGLPYLAHDPRRRVLRGGHGQRGDEEQHSEDRSHSGLPLCLELYCRPPPPLRLMTIECAEGNVGSNREST